MKISEDDFNEALRRFTTLSNDMTRRSILRAAVEAIPEPASHADALPVPGAAVRALVARWENATFFPAHCLVELKLALEQDGLASQALPRFRVTAEEMRQAVRQTCGAEWDEILWHELNVVLARRPAHDGASAEQLRAALAECVWALEAWGSWEDGVPSSDEGGEHGRVGVAYDTARMLLGYADDGKRTSALLARRPAADEAEALRKRLEHAEDILRDLASYVGNGGYNAPDPIDLETFRQKIRDGIDADERVKAQIASRKCPACESPSPRLHPAVQCEGEVHLCRDACHLPGDVERLESQLASLTAERDTARKFGRVAEEERDEALSLLAKAEREASAVVCALDDAGVPGVVGVDGPVLDCVDRPAVVVGETGGSPGRVKWLANQLEFYRKSTEHAEKLIEQLREQLAARPETVVIDEALAELVFDAYYRAPNVSGRTAMLVALRSVFGDRASVSVPQGERARCERAQYEELRRGWQKTTAERDQLRAEIERTRQEAATHHSSWVTAVNTLYEVNVALGKRTPDKTDNPVQLAAKVFAELEKTRAGLEACRERRDELEQTCESQDEELAQLREQHEALRAAAQYVLDRYGYHADNGVAELRALLEPAPVEAEPVQHPPPEWPDTLLDGTRGRAEVFREALIAERSGMHPPPESAMVGQPPPFTAEELRRILVANLRALSEALDARKGGGQ